MDNRLYQEIIADLPQFNPDIAKGYSVKDMEDAEEYIHRIFECASADFPPIFKFVGLRRLTPEEEQREIERTSERIPERDVSQTDVYMCEAIFDFDGQKVTRNINLPYMREAGTIFLRGSRSTIHPILADLVFSVSDLGLFTMLLRAKFTLTRTNYGVLKDGESITHFVVAGNIYQSKESVADSRKANKVESTIGHYLFCKYGVTETFKRYYDTDVIIEEKRPGLSEIYPVEDYVMFTTMGLPPLEKRRREQSDWTPTNLVLIIPRDKCEEHPGVSLLATHFFYVIDQFPSRFTLEHIDQDGTWRIAMGYILHRAKENEGKLLNEIDKHLNSLDRYVDYETKRHLEMEGIQVDNLYDLFVHVLDTITSRIVNDNSGRMWGKHLLVKRYALSGITEAIFNFTWQLEKERDSLTFRRLRWTLSRMITPDAFLGIQSKHGELGSVQYPGDCMIFKHTCVSIRQMNAVTGKGKTKSFKPNELAYQLDGSIAEAGSACNFAKGSPDGRSRLNMFLHIDKNGRIVRNPDLVELIDQAQKEISKY
ncbi:hypothetical protein CPT_Moabite_130 [Serratia phage Moabite]|uniref:Uncharacterized protein n=1 Tax=Serratia phage Moabite TaxID=2587814 RepID=A0A4Y5TRG5_9CAUD|nr:polymerase [Serratia phage Moabite]QDB71160.1 hypothetical protein CPT_Moabite_130 [Serratia phage Moabite]